MYFIEPYVDGGLLQLKLSGYYFIEAEQLAFDGFIDLIQEGLKKHGKGTWRDEPSNHHSVRAGRHSITATDLNEEEKYQDEDKEAHLTRALVRAAMALYCHKNKN